MNKHMTVRANNFSNFKAYHAAEAAWLENNYLRNDFARSLFEQAQYRGTLSEKQIAAIQRNLAPAVIELASVSRAFDHARAAGLKAPRLRLPEFVFSLATTNSFNVGMIYVKAKDGTYLGKITKHGAFFPSRCCEESHKEALRNLDLDVVAAAKKYGQETGECSCCGRLLTDPESVERGIGPICAGKFGLTNGISEPTNGIDVMA